MEAHCTPPSFAQREFFRLNAQTSLPKTNSDLARLHPTAACYKAKNRYADVLPLESTRVRLKFEELSRSAVSDYINASHVGHQHLRFICTQAPLPSTFLDFWQMVWEQNSPIICSLNREFEKGVVKGDVYWPLSASLPIELAHFRISLDAILDMQEHDLTIRYLSILHKTRRESRRIVQIHFHGWPDKGVPKSTRALRELLALHNYFRGRTPLPFSSSSGESSLTAEAITELSPLEGPTIAHCSAGVGRTGVFVTSAILLESESFRNALCDPVFVSEFLEHVPSSPSEESMAIPGYFIPPLEPRDEWQEKLERFGVAQVVQMLREQRNAGMVQTEEQYSLIYSVLKDAIIEEAQKDSRSVYHVADCEVIKLVASFEEKHPFSSSSATDPNDIMRETRSDVCPMERGRAIRRSASQTSPVPRRSNSRKKGQSGRKRLIDWDSENASELTDACSNDMDIDITFPMMSDRTRRTKLARTLRDSPRQEETLLNFS